MEFRESRIIHAPIEQVWSKFTDVVQYPVYLSSMTQLVLEGEEQNNVEFKVGLAWTQTRIIGGYSGSERLELTNICTEKSSSGPSMSFVQTGGGGGMIYYLTYRFTEVPENADEVKKWTNVEYEFKAVPTNIFAQLLVYLFGGFGKQSTIDCMRQDLEDWAKVCEQ